MLRWRESLPARRRPGFRIVHVDHQLRPDSKAAARFCRALAKSNGVACKVLTIEVPRRRGESLEAAARTARYTAIARELDADEWLVTAHHCDDQLETMLLQLMRGSGVAGLAAMSELGREPLPILRPLLAIDRDELEAWLRAEGASWVEDETNLDERFDRNYLRHRVVPLLRARWPAAARVAARSAGHLGEAKQLLHELAMLDLAHIALDAAVDVYALQELSLARQRNVLRHWIALQGLSTPDAVHLERIRYELPVARADAQPVVRWEGGEVRRFRGALYALASVPADGRDNFDPARAQRWNWRRQPRFQLGDGLGCLYWQEDPHGNVARDTLPASLRVVRRHGGERLRTSAAGPRQSVKELLRAAGVLPWERERLPLLLDGDAVVAVANLFVAAEYQYTNGERRDGERLRLVWEGAPTVLAVPRQR